MWLGGPVKLGFNPVSREKMYAFILEHVPDNPWFAPEEQLAHVAGLLALLTADTSRGPRRSRARTPWSITARSNG